MEEQKPTPCAWVIKQHLNPDALKEYVSRMGVERSQIIAITEPQDGMFTLIFEPNADQQSALTAEESEVAETLDALFGVAVTPVQAPSGAEVETVVAVPVTPVSVPPPPAPVEPSPT